MQCEQCRKIVPDDSIKMVPKMTHIAACNICRGEVKEKIRPKHLLIERADELPQRRVFYCDRCKYKFRHNPRSSVKLYCPWCGKGDQASQLE